MKSPIIKLCALLVAILIIISCLPTFILAAEPTVYSKDSNSGTRGEICTTLDGTGALAYYSGSYTYAVLSSLSSSVLKNSLHKLMTDTHRYVTSYADCRDYVWKTDCEQNNTSRATTLYISHSMTESEWSPAWSCNREHVWPKSLGGNTTDKGGSDLHHIRPTDAGVNSLRGNTPYGESNGYYEPSDNVKGDVARIILYVHVRWDSEWGAANINSVFESVDILLEWCALDPVDTWEMGRNEVVENIQGNRNVFIDYPEFAWQLFGKQAPENMITPSGSALNGEIPSIPNGGNNEETTQKPGQDTDNTENDRPLNMLAEFDFGANGTATHNDGAEATGAYSYTDGDYSLNLTNLTKIFINAKDAAGNSCVKVGASSSVGSFTFTVGDDVDKVIIYVAQYKTKNTTVSVCGAEYSITTASNSGEYTPITVDTSENKTVTFSTCSGATRCMINTIEFWSVAEEPDIEIPTPENTDTETTATETETTDTETEPTSTESETTTTEGEKSTSEIEATITEEETTVSEIEATTPEIETDEDKTESTLHKEETTTVKAENAETSAPYAEVFGCQSTLTGGCALIIVLCIGLYSVTRGKKDAE